MSIITLTTDFGVSSPYVAAMKGVILSIDAAARVVDVTHEIAAQDVWAGAVVLADVTRWFPPGTIHVAVIDPGVGTDRAIVYAEIAEQRYVVPDNGLLSLLVDRSPPARLIRLAAREHWLPEVSNTFHGRDIMAPVAARLSLGLDPEQLGPPLAELTLLKQPQVSVRPDRIDGVVMAIDSFGNLITNITADLLAGRPTDMRACIACGIYETWGIYHAYAEQGEGMLVALIDSGNRLELAIVGDNAAERLGIRVGTPVVVAWE